MQDSWARSNKVKKLPFLQSTLKHPLKSGTELTDVIYNFDSSLANLDQTIPAYYRFSTVKIPRLTFIMVQTKGSKVYQRVEGELTLGPYRKLFPRINPPPSLEFARQWIHQHLEYVFHRNDTLESYSDIATEFQRSGVSTIKNLAIRVA